MRLLENPRFDFLARIFRYLFKPRIAITKNVILDLPERIKYMPGAEGGWCSIPFLKFQTLKKMLNASAFSARLLH